MREFTIRPIEPGDLATLYAICVRTGAAGHDATGRYADPDLLGHVYVGPYVRMESGFGLVLDVDGEPLGYALATADTAAFEAECAVAWWPALRRRYPLTGAGPRDDAGLIAMIHRPEPTEPDLLAGYPAHLHVDLLPATQGLGAGRALLDAVEGELARRGATGVHLGTDPANVRAQGFYEHLGYRRLDAGQLGTRPDAVVFVKSLV